MASIYRHRNGWQASVTVRGQNLKKNFPSQREANAWAEATATELRRAYAPHLGGPTRVTLAQLLFEYAQHYTVTKKSAKSELDRINRYLGPAGLPRLKLVRDEEGHLELETLAPEFDASELPDAFAAVHGERSQARSGTASVRARLATSTVSRLTTMDFRQFITVMHSEGLSGSTMQKEIALLKHAFNQAITEWNWKSFSNPLAGMKLPKSAPGRDVVMSAERERGLRNALIECDNPYILPLYDLAVETTARRGSLLNLTWERIDLEERYMLLYDTKSGDNVTTPLTLRAVEILAALKRNAREARVFPISANALRMAWRRACERAGETDLRFHDARHIGTTRHARRLRNPDLLRQMTGHRSNQMLSRYTHLMREDALAILDQTEAPPPTNVDDTRDASLQARRDMRLARQAEEILERRRAPPAPREEAEQAPCEPAKAPEPVAPAQPLPSPRQGEDRPATRPQPPSDTVVVVDFARRRRSA